MGLSALANHTCIHSASPPCIFDAGLGMLTGSPSVIWPELHLELLLHPKADALTISPQTPHHHPILPPRTAVNRNRRTACDNGHDGGNRRGPHAQVRALPGHGRDSIRDDLRNNRSSLRHRKIRYRDSRSRHVQTGPHHEGTHHHTSNHANVGITDRTMQFTVPHPRGNVRNHRRLRPRRRRPDRRQHETTAGGELQLVQWLPASCVWAIRRPDGFGGGVCDWDCGRYGTY